MSRLSPVTTVSDPEATLVAAPNLRFAELRAVLSALGWVLEYQTQDPIVAGEPELAQFTHLTAPARVHYTFNPVVSLRVLRFRGDAAGPQRAEVARRITTLGTDDVRRLLSSADVRELLLGLLAAGQLREIPVLDQVSGLCRHPDPKVSRAASQVLDGLVSESVGLAAQRIRAESAARPDRSALFAHLPGPELRRQVLRWLMHDFALSTAGIDHVLRSALADPDPEVRVTAVLAAARLTARSVLEDVRRADIPTSTSRGADERNRLFFAQLRRAVVGYLSAGDRPELSGPKARQREHFIRAIRGQLEVRDDPTLLLHALTAPLDLGSPPDHVPAAVEESDGTYRLRVSRLIMRWVAPVPHWLGEDSSRPPRPDNPVRLVRPSSGFFIAETPVTCAAGRAALSADRPSSEIELEDQEVFLCTHLQAVQFCEALTRVEGLPIRLPSADEWEMAARGPDGRRYPWGNCLLPDITCWPSPWRLAGLGLAPEWASQLGEAVICGGTDTVVCAQRQCVSDGSPPLVCAPRPVICPSLGS